jgi:hypothetical protein
VNGAGVPVTWEIRGCTLVVTLRGNCGDETVRAIAAAMQDPQFAPGKSLLFDARLATEHPTSADVQRRAAWVAALQSEGISRRCATVVGPKPYQYGLARMAATYLDFEGMEMEIFKEMEAAIDWLERAAPQRVRTAGG